jgi:hypothetical protein
MFYSDSPVAVTDFVFLGNEQHAINAVLLDSLRITGVVNGMKLLFLFFSSLSDFVFLWIFYTITIIECSISSQQDLLN